MKYQKWYTNRLEWLGNYALNLGDHNIKAVVGYTYEKSIWEQIGGSNNDFSFELFYWDLTFGLFFTALLGALTLGSLGGEGRTFFGDLAVMDWNSMKYALLGGIVWNFGNIFLPRYKHIITK